MTLISRRWLHFGGADGEACDHRQVLRNAIDYAGAVGRLDLSSVSGLGSRYAVQPKIDGAYCRIHLDSQGCIDRIYSRTGREFGDGQIEDLRGCRIGTPRAELVGELEGHTEAGRRVAARRGYQIIHLFDALRIDGEYLGHAPYRDRRDAMWRMQSILVEHDPDRQWYSDREGNAHDIATGDYCRRIPRGWRRAAIVPQLAAAQADTMWADHVAGGDAEGLVVVALDAPVGKRGAKRKVKVADTIDAVCLSVDRGGALMRWMAAGVSFAIGHRRGVELRPGMIYEIACDGFYESTSEPRFARLVRCRTDLLA